jgi:hypothetical protein
MTTASYDMLQHRIGSQNEPLVRTSETGGHELAAERLLVDVDDLGSYVKKDLQNLGAAIRNPTIARVQLERSRGNNVSGEQVSADSLSLQEIYEYVDAMIEAPRENFDEEAMHRLSLTLVRGLVKDWENRQHTAVLKGSLARGKVGERVEFGEPVVRGQESIATHIAQHKGEVQSNFHELHGKVVQQLGEVAADAAGVSQSSGNEADSVQSVSDADFLAYAERQLADESGAMPGADPAAEDEAIRAAQRILNSGERPKTRREFMDALSVQESGRILHDPREVDNVLAAVWEQAERTGALRNEAVQRQYSYLTKCVNAWHGVAVKQGTVGGFDFGSFMQGMRERQDARVARFAEIRQVPPAKERAVMDAFDAAWRIYRGGQGEPPYNFVKVVDAQAYQKARQEVNRRRGN